MEKTLLNLDNQIKSLLTKQGYTDIELDAENKDKVIYNAYIDAEVIVTLRLNENKVDVYDQYLDEKHSAHIVSISYDELINT